MRESAARGPLRKNLPVVPVPGTPSVEHKPDRPGQRRLVLAFGLAVRCFRSPSHCAIDQYTTKWAKYGGLDYVEQAQVREHIDAVFDTLKSQMTSIPPQDYVACRTFLQSLLYATTRSIL